MREWAPAPTVQHAPDVYKTENCIHFEATPSVFRMHTEACRHGNHYVLVTLVNLGVSLFAPKTQRALQESKGRSELDADFSLLQSSVVSEVEELVQFYNGFTLLPIHNW